INNHWSAGLRVGLRSSTRDNYRNVSEALPALEYDLFPYSQSTRRQLRLEYDIGMSHFVYNDTTILNKTKETMPLHRLFVTVATREPWGSVNVGASGVSYLNDRTKYRVGAFGEISWRVFRGFSFDMFGNYELIRDQFNLAKRQENLADVLTGRFQLKTSYDYFGRVGFSYTF